MAWLTNIYVTMAWLTFIPSGETSTEKKEKNSISKLVSVLITVKCPTASWKKKTTLHPNILIGYNPISVLKIDGKNVLSGNFGLFIYTGTLAKVCRVNIALARTKEVSIYHRKKHFHVTILATKRAESFYPNAANIVRQHFRTYKSENIKSSWATILQI